MPKLVVYTRVGCHLCGEAELAARRIALRTGVDVELVDIDADPALVERYTVRVPVVTLDGAEIAELQVDEDSLSMAVDEALARDGSQRQGRSIRHRAPVPAALPERPRPRAGGAARIAGWTGLVVHLAVGVFPYAASGVVAPAAAVVGLLAAWAALLGLALRLRKRRPLWVPLVPGGALALWFVVLSFGDRYLGWTA